MILFRKKKVYWKSIILAEEASKPGHIAEIGERRSRLGRFMLGCRLCRHRNLCLLRPWHTDRNVGSLAGFFVLMTMSVFILLTIEYAEVTRRYPQGGGVITVAAQAINHWVGALGGMFILVDYFLTAAISCLSGILYLSVVIPEMEPYALLITIATLILLGILNLVGISASAKVSLVGASIAFLSDIGSSHYRLFACIHS